MSDPKNPGKYGELKWDQDALGVKQGPLEITKNSDGSFHIGAAKPPPDLKATQPTATPNARKKPSPPSHQP
jgi:hypothetical protein